MVVNIISISYENKMYMYIYSGATNQVVFLSSRGITKGKVLCCRIRLLQQFFNSCRV